MRFSTAKKEKNGEDDSSEVRIEEFSGAWHELAYQARIGNRPSEEPIETRRRK